jgi:hypothetical protein
MNKLLALTLLLTSCGSFMGQQGKRITISSEPEGANVAVINSSNRMTNYGITPFEIKPKTGKGYFTGETYTLMFAKEGYKDGSIKLESKISGWYFGNFILGGPIGMLLVDPLTGGMWTFRENEVVYPLIKNP